MPPVLQGTQSPHSPHAALSFIASLSPSHLHSQLEDWLSSAAQTAPPHLTFLPGIMCPRARGQTFLLPRLPLSRSQGAAKTGCYSKPKAGKGPCGDRQPGLVLFLQQVLRLLDRVRRAYSHTTTPCPAKFLKVMVSPVQVWALYKVQLFCREPLACGNSQD